MKNEIGNLNQAQSNKATILKEYLEIIIMGKDSIAKEFSDKFMIKNLQHMGSPNTIRNITKRLYNDGIIEKTRTGLSNEKFYKIKNYERANTLYQQCIGQYIFNRKNKPKNAFTPFGIIEDPPQNLENNFLLRLKQGSKEIQYLYPKINYQQNTCPICSGELIKYKHGKVGKGSIVHPEIPSHDFDRKCTKCRSKFHFQASSNDKFRELGDELNKKAKESIIIEPTKEVSDYLVSKWVNDDKMISLSKETRKILENANSAWKKLSDSEWNKFFEGRY